jgi:hypothetical protein
MAKPRTFVSSTCLDLRDARATIGEHLVVLGHEPLLSDTLNFGVRPGRHSHQACLDQVDNADYFILIVGGRRGGTYIGSERSITNEEYRRARKRGIPIMTFVSEDVMTASRIYRKNPKADFSDLVDDHRIFDFVDLIRGESEDNWIREYKTAEDIKDAITAQFAYICLLYSQQGRKKPEMAADDSRRTAKRLPRELNLGKISDSHRAALTAGLKSLHRILSKLLGADVSGKDEKLKVLWLLGRYGQSQGRGSSYLAMNFDRFKQFAFAAARARRVFNQLKDFDVLMDFDEEYDGEGPKVELWFKDDDDGAMLEALTYYIECLLKRYSEDDALEMFKRADMSVFA